MCLCVLPSLVIYHSKKTLDYRAGVKGEDSLWEEVDVCARLLQTDSAATSVAL